MMSCLFIAPLPFAKNRVALTSHAISTKMTVGASNKLAVHVGDAGLLAANHVAALKPSSVAVSGGSLPKLLAAGLKQVGLSDAPKTWKNIFLADERWVPLDDADSNFRSIFEHLKCELVKINPELSVTEGAKKYQEKLVEQLGSPPTIDCVLLGLGPDGHTCSLFPKHKLVRIVHPYFPFHH